MLPSGNGELVVVTWQDRLLIMTSLILYSLLGGTITPLSNKHKIGDVIMRRRSCHVTSNSSPFRRMVENSAVNDMVSWVELSWIQLFTGVVLPTTWQLKFGFTPNPSTNTNQRRLERYVKSKRTRQESYVRQKNKSLNIGLGLWYEMSAYQFVLKCPTRIQMVHSAQ